jgi:sirohydrochlorin cobaltochelatase
MKSTYLVIAHGSRDKKANQAFFDFLKSFREVFTGKKVEGAFLELARPSVLEAIYQAITGGSEEIFILPLMFFEGRHVKQDIPRFIQEAKARYPEVDFHYAGPLAGHPMLLKLLKAKAQAMKGKR